MKCVLLYVTSSRRELRMKSYVFKSRVWRPLLSKNFLWVLNTEVSDRKIYEDNFMIYWGKISLLNNGKRWGNWKCFICSLPSEKPKDLKSFENCESRSCIKCVTIKIKKLQKLLFSVCSANPRCDSLSKCFFFSNFYQSFSS